MVGPPSALGWLTVGHLIWGGLGTYVLLRSFAQGRWAATVAAGVYLASPFLLAHTFEGHYPHVWAAAGIPGRSGPLDKRESNAGAAGCSCRLSWH